MKTQREINQMIFNYTDGINNNTYYKDTNSRVMVGNNIVELMNNINDKNSLGYKILQNQKDGVNFTDKQRWVITFELIKNQEFVNKVEEFYKGIKKDKKVKLKDIKPIPTRRRVRDIEVKVEDFGFEINDKVNHNTFGNGIITEITEEIVTINFEEVGVKKMVKKFTKITKTK